MERKQAEKELLKLSGMPEERIILMSKFSPVPYAEKITAKFKFKYDKYNRFWRYDSDNGIWKEDAESFIKNLLRRELFGEEQQKVTYANEIVSYIRDFFYDPNFEGKLADNLIPFKNCLYDVDKEDFIEFSDEYFVTNKIPCIIDSKFTDCDVVDAFFSDCVGETFRDILYDLTAYCMYRSYPYQKLFFLVGGGNNGKSSYLELLRAFLGAENVSSKSPHEICGGSRFALGELWNKYANVSSDISYEVLNEINKIKEITGGDTISIERKFKDSFPDRLYAKQIFSTNQLPIVNDRTKAWYRRIYLIEFPNEVAVPDREILKKLTTQTQLSGLAWICVKRLKEMKKKGFVFEHDIDVQKIGDMYEKLSNPLIKFVSENCVEEEWNPEAFIWKYEFKDKFLSWLKLNKFRQWSDIEVGVEMKKKYHDSQKTVPFSGNPPKIYRCWDGIKWTSQVSQISHPFIISTIYIETNNKTLLKPLNLLRKEEVT